MPSRPTRQPFEAAEFLCVHAAKSRLHTRLWSSRRSGHCAYHRSCSLLAIPYIPG
nr:hypothetical protein [Kibdelosporangium sp. MJ126-NF4]CTQ89055.1 hypothetical protein [Kibdelosporangium sp. MJ126-NF4]